MAAAPAKFTFDLDLGHRAQRDIGDAVERARLAELEEARAHGFAAGRAEGIAEGERGASAQSARQMAAAATQLADQVATMAASIDDSRASTLNGAVDLAASIARKLAGTLLTQQPAAEIEALLVECLASLDGVPHLVIRCHPDLAEAVREMATARISTSGFTGRLVVLGEPEQALGDCRLEWVDGGLVRDSAAINAEIDNRIAAYLAAANSNRGDPVAEEIEP
jgi:flagellar assembly protein FliH